MSPTVRWPQRRRKRTSGLPPERTDSLAPGGPAGKQAPLLVPARKRDAAAAAGVALLVLTLLGLFLLWLLADWPPTTLPARIIYAAIGVGALFTIALFALSLVAYSLPRLLGLRRGAPSTPARPKRQAAHTPSEK